MGYNIYIGNAMLEGRYDDDDCATYEAHWSVDAVTDEDAPAAENDTNPNCNYRWPSYSGWVNFTRGVGLHSLFYDKPAGLMSQHPGCFKLTREHSARISEALATFRSKHPDARAGFGDCEPGEVSTRSDADGALARLEWLDWWVRWALDNCRRPAMYNS